MWPTKPKLLSGGTQKKFADHCSREIIALSGLRGLWFSQRGKGPDCKACRSMCKTPRMVLIK